MAVQPTYPGVYVQEVPSGVRTITGVGTSIGLFIGASKKGPLDKPVRCSNYTTFKNKFGDNTDTCQLANYVKLFFLNGGTDCYVLRVAKDAAASSVTLLNEKGDYDALILTAKDLGVSGEDIRAIVTYTGAQPESTFNLELYIWEFVGGIRNKVRREVWKNLSMNLFSSRFAPTFITQNSQLVNATLPGAQAPLTQGYSQSGRPIPHQATGQSFRTEWGKLIGNSATATNRFMISVDSNPFIEIDLNNPVLDVNAMVPATVRTDLASEIKNRIINQYAANGVAGLNLDVAFVPGPKTALPATETTLLNISSVTNGDIYIRPVNQADLAIPLMLGADQGGLEIPSHSVRRPAPNGITLQGSDPAVWLALANLPQDTFTPLANGIVLDQFLPLPVVGTVACPVVHFTNLVTNNAADFFYQDNNAGSKNGNNDGLRDKLQRMATAINDRAKTEPLFRWNAQVAGMRLSILPTEVVDDNFLGSKFNAPGFPNLGGGKLTFLNNVKAYTLGAGGFNIGSRQGKVNIGKDGGSPFPADYDKAYSDIIDNEVDLFNLMILPPDNDSSAVSIQSLYGNASVFCRNRRAFLLMDPPESWKDSQTASTGVASLRTGLVKDYSAIFFPRITVNENNLNKNIGPAGAIAGLFSRIDTNRGVWKAPAGTEADLRGITGLEYRFSDRENGQLNPHAVNTIRIFPNGIVNWGARTMDGDDDFASEYKYIPIRRTALFIEESLYRGLKWVVFEPNDEPLWAQIRLNVGAFMHNLFRQGAFQGKTKQEAYFVKCDSETTTQNDIDLGIVNIWVGFAPLKPAEFVILYLQQMSGQIQV